jgi:CRP/FNR family nitrogen fixation transcriptional regulator
MGVAFYRGPKSLGRKRGRRSSASSSTSRSRSFDLMGTPTSFSRNEKIFGKGEPGEYLYKVESGCIRTSDVLNDGRRWIDTFYLPGEFFGLEARENHAISAEAITQSSVRVIKRKAVVSRAARDITVVKSLMDIVAKELQRKLNHNRLLVKGARERVVDFLLEMKNRREVQDEIDLPMGRLDIANYLGLSIETVSRVLTQLKSASAISFTNPRRITLRDLSVLN